MTIEQLTEGYSIYEEIKRLNYIFKSGYTIEEYCINNKITINSKTLDKIKELIRQDIQSQIDECHKQLQKI